MDRRNPMALSGSTSYYTQRGIVVPGSGGQPELHGSPGIHQLSNPNASYQSNMKSTIHLLYLDNKSDRVLEEASNKAFKIRQQKTTAENLPGAKSSVSRAVEDIDWDSFTVKGTCQEIEKRYLWLTSAPDPATVRPEEVLEKALLMVQNSQKNYLYKCDQLKSIHQDLTVQRIQNQLTVNVYETHARLALEVGDLPEYNQCQSQLQSLYSEGIEGCHMEFAAYNLLCVILLSSNNRDLVSSMSRLSSEAKRDNAVRHALAVRAAFKAVCCISRSYRPTLPVSYIAQVLSISSVASDNDEKDLDGLEECIEWLKAHGACLITDNNGEMQLDAKIGTAKYVDI
ncbi:SAC3 family protein A-like [Humulus lupulus]|uniref:SAC3 family protein A-like n=1 Tax=Humulus lupulus TaxID=3486 RepID=UPI002B412ED1|nr:SAC3 family protein A-like [Humulus lupulus]